MTNKNKGFASMDKELVKKIAQKGGAARKAQLGPGGYANLGKKNVPANKKDD